MSATMNLLKGKGKATAAPPADETDAELASPAPEAAEPDGSEDDSQEAEQAEGVEAGEEVAEAAPAVTIPTSKTEVHALKLADMPAVHEAMGSPVAGFATLDAKGKKQALLDHLFPKGGKAKAAVAGSDTLTTISQEIENLKTRGEVEDRLNVIIQAEGENFFRKGGLLVKLSEIGDFGEHANLQDYILANGLAKDYRTARYWMSIYTGLLEAGIPYSDVEGIGWTKIMTILPVINKENLADWMAKAKAMTVITLQATVKAELETPGSTSTTTGGAPTEIKSMVFKFHKDQTDTANDAIAKAKKVAGTEVKEVAADLIFTEYLANAPNKVKAKAEPTGPVEIVFDPDKLEPGHVKAFFEAIAARYPDPKEAMGFLFSGPDDEPDDKGYFELTFPTVDIDLNIPDAD